MQKIYILFLGILLISCGEKGKNTESSSAQEKEVFSLKDGSWRVALAVQDEKELPFIFTTTAKGIEIHNAEERISVDDITIKDDAITIKMDVYEGVLKGKFIDENTIKGEFIKVSLDRYVPFTATFGETKRFLTKNVKATANITGNWETVFSPTVAADRYIAKGIFTQNGNTVTGTFRTTTGDYRYLEGTLSGNQLRTWCPNCLDESKYYANYANNNSEVKFVALAFEYTKTKEKAFNNIKRLQKRLGIPYPILLAQFGTSDKKKAQEKLPMLNHVLSYPTTIFIDKKGKVRRIHTGFNGPATGDKYITFKKDFENFVSKLENE